MTRCDLKELAGSVGLGLWAAFAVLAAFAAGAGGAPLELDQDLLTWSVGHRPEWALTLARMVTATGTGVIPYVLVALAGVVAGRTPRQRLTAAALCLACLAVAQAFRYAVMEPAHRPRPPHADWSTHASGWAFPSGHSTTSALAAGLLMVAVSVRAPRGATPLRLLIGCWGATVGLTRIHLGVHWATDVLGGWLFATAWLTACLWAAARWLPGGLPARKTTAPTPREDHASEDPHR
ncbi:phosphatase PAP2 family protein [Streptomyces sp. NPDC048514]|uniref:phosphatase PAP2 family protein n=1 Tax=Streptomyces sp. NPDC048514 TaxID=3365564 RepID=UPI00371E2C26